MKFQIAGADVVANMATDNAVAPAVSKLCGRNFVAGFNAAGLAYDGANDAPSVCSKLLLYIAVVRYGYIHIRLYILLKYYQIVF